MNRPMFVYAGVYDDVATAAADYAAIRALNTAAIIGSCDAAVVGRALDGSIRLDRREQPTQHGAWAGIAATAAIAVAAPRAMPALVAASGAGLGAWVGHLARGLSRRDLREIGEALGESSAALVVVGINRDAAHVQKAASNALRYTTKRVEGDYSQAEQDALATMVAA